MIYNKKDDTSQSYTITASPSSATTTAGTTLVFTCTITSTSGSLATTDIIWSYFNTSAPSPATPTYIYMSGAYQNGLSTTYTVTNSGSGTTLTSIISWVATWWDNSLTYVCECNHYLGCSSNSLTQAVITIIATSKFY